MANPRRNTQSSENPFHAQTLTSSSVTHFLKKPHAFPFLLSIFLFLTWVSLRLQHSSSPSRFSINRDDAHKKWSQSSDSRANLVRFGSGFPSPIAKDKRGWFLDPISLAKDSRISGGALSCVSLHLGEIRPGGLRGNHRHHSCNETFVIWGAETRFRLENDQVDEGYAEVTIGADEVAVAASPSSTAHALINIDPVGDSDQKLADGISLYSIIGPLITEHAKRRIKVCNNLQGGKAAGNALATARRDFDSLQRVAIRLWAVQKAGGGKEGHGIIKQGIKYDDRKESRVET